METRVVYDEARSAIIDFFNHEFKGFDNLLMSHFLNRFNDFLNYDEEGIKYKPKFIFTNNINELAKNVNKSYILEIFQDDSASNFNNRLKPMIAIASSDWSIYIELKDNKITYGLCKALNSIKDKDFISILKTSNELKEKSDKVSCIIAKCVNYYTMSFYSIKGNKLEINLSLDNEKQTFDSNHIHMFVDATFSKVRTTKQKLNDVKTMFFNVVNKVTSEVNGAICVVVDKDYKDTGFFEDGIWLKEPISFNKLFSNSKSYSEEKLQAFCQLFMGMLQFDGITVVDNTGRIRGYNIFVETENKRVKNIVGGARKRAAYTIINTKRKHILGVYFQSHEGEIFYTPVKANIKVKKTSRPATPTPPPEVEKELVTPKTDSTVNEKLNIAENVELVEKIDKLENKDRIEIAEKVEIQEKVEENK